MRGFGSSKECYTNWESSIETYTLSHIKWIAGGSCYIIQGAQPGAPWQPRGGEGGVGSKVQEGGDTSILVADSLCYMAEADTTL